MFALPPAGPLCGSVATAAVNDALTVSPRGLLASEARGTRTHLVAFTAALQSGGKNVAGAFFTNGADCGSATLSAPRGQRP